MKYSYENFGRIIKLNYPDGQNVEYDYDAGGNLQKVKNETQGGFFVSHIGYDKFGQRTSMLLGDGTTTCYSFKYCGKELDRMHGLNWYDSSARYYDHVLGRFHQIDPLAENGWRRAFVLYLFTMFFVAVTANQHYSFTPVDIKQARMVYVAEKYLFQGESQTCYIAMKMSRQDSVATCLYGLSWKENCDSLFFSQLPEGYVFDIEN